MITFHGYKNIITNDMKFDNNTRLTFIAMQLNDEGKPDLTEFRSIKDMSFIDDKSDIFTMMYSNFNYIPDRLFFEDKSLFLGDELANLHEECGDNNIYKREENASMKAYTLMASLTKRMMQNPGFKIDEGFALVFNKLLMQFSNSLNSKPMAVYQVLQHCVRAGEPLDKTAAFFNKFIDTSMKKFFKI